MAHIVQDVRRVGYLIYVAPKVASALTHWCLAEICRRSSLARLIDALAQVAPAGAGDVRVVLHGPACGPIPLQDELQAEVGRVGAEFRISRATTLLGVLAEAAGSSRFHRLAVWPENAIFPDTGLLSELLSSHDEREADASWAANVPLGVAPELYSCDAIRRLSTLELPSGLVVPPLTIMTEANRITAANGTVAFRLNPLDGSTRYADGARPVLIQSVEAQQAAERIILRGRDCRRLDSPQAFQDEIKESARRDCQNATGSKRLADTKKSGPNLRVLYATLATALSGAEVSFSRLIRCVPPRAVEPTIIVRARSAFTRRLDAAGIAYDIPVDDISALTPASFGYFSRILREHRIDLVHLDSFAIPGLVMAAVSIGLPIIQHVRVIVEGGLPEMSGFVTMFIAISKAVRQSLLRAGVDDERIRVVYNGVGLDFPCDDDADHWIHDIPAGKPVVTMAARISRQKRQDVLLRALPMIRDAVPDVVVIFAGEVFPSELSYCAELAELVCRSGLEDVVRFVGYVPGISELYRMSTALVLCTSEEPLGISLLEGAIIGPTIVAPRSAGPAEVFRDREDSMLYEPGNAEDLARCILAVLQRPELRAELSQAARNTAADYSLDKYADGVVSVYKDVLGMSA